MPVLSIYPTPQGTSSKKKKVRVASLQEIMDSTPIPSIKRKIFYAPELEFEEARVLGRFQEYLLMNQLDFRDWVFKDDFLALKCLNACKRSFPKTYERLLMILKHTDRVTTMNRRDFRDILVKNT